MGEAMILRKCARQQSILEDLRLRQLAPWQTTATIRAQGLWIETAYVQNASMESGYS